MSKGKIYIKSDWAYKIFMGLKFVETRAFGLPDRFKNIELDVQTENGFIVGSLQFAKTFQFQNEKEFDLWSFAHLVKKDSPFHFSNRKQTHGWVVQNFTAREPKLARRFKGQFPLELYESAPTN